MRYIYAGLAAAALAAGGTGALAHGHEVARFTGPASGHHIVVKSDGAQSCITGVDPASGKRFDLHVTARGMVVGTYGGADVRFRANPASVAAIRALAARSDRS